MATTELFIKMVFNRWNASLKNFDTLLNGLSETLQKEIAPGKNRGIYLLGHMIAVHDEMLILLDMGEKLYPELYEPFLNMADKATSLVSYNYLNNKYNDSIKFYNNNCSK